MDKLKRRLALIQPMTAGFFDIAFFAGLALIRERSTREVALRKREAILRAIETHPGSPLQELAKRLAVPMGTLRHHVDDLVKAGHVRTMRVGRRRIAYPAGAYVEEFNEDRALLQEESSRRVVAAILACQPCGIMDIVEHSGLSQRVVYHHAKRLLDAGLIVRGSNAHYRGLRPTPRLFALLGS